jgi:SAM-dependent methyltransferase
MDATIRTPPAGAAATGAAPARPVDDRRAHLRTMWAAVAPSWGEHADYTDARHEQSSQALLDLAKPRAGERVLELACGAGGLGLAAAELVLPGGEVVLSDVAAEMTAIARDRARERGVTNVSTREIDLEQIDQPDASYDVVLCRDGLQFAPDPARATREIARVLRPGGRVALATWADRGANPWLGVVFDAVSAQTGKQLPPAGMPGPFSLADAGQLSDLLSDAGLVDVVVSELPTPLQAASFDDWWTRTCALAGPLAAMVAALPEGPSQALRERAREMTTGYRTATGLEFPGLALLATGRRP